MVLHRWPPWLMLALNLYVLYADLTTSFLVRKVSPGRWRWAISSLRGLWLQILIAAKCWTCARFDWSNVIHYRLAPNFSILQVLFIAAYGVEQCLFCCSPKSLLVLLHLHLLAELVWALARCFCRRWCFGHVNCSLWLKIFELLFGRWWHVWHIVAARGDVGRLIEISGCQRAINEDRHWFAFELAFIVAHHLLELACVQLHAPLLTRLRLNANRPFCWAIPLRLAEVHWAGEHIWVATTHLLDHQDWVVRWQYGVEGLLLVNVDVWKGRACPALKDKVLLHDRALASLRLSFVHHWHWWLLRYAQLADADLTCLNQFS